MFKLSTKLQINTKLNLPNMKVVSKLITNDINKLVPVKTGNLKNSLVVTNSNNYFNIRFKAVYAAIQNFGGTIPITELSRRKFWALYASTNNPMYKYMAITKEKFFKIKAHNFVNYNRLQALISNYIKNIKQ